MPFEMPFQLWMEDFPQENWPAGFLERSRVVAVPREIPRPTVRPATAPKQANKSKLQRGFEKVYDIAKYKNQCFKEQRDIGIRIRLHQLQLWNKLKEFQKKVRAARKRALNNVSSPPPTPLANPTIRISSVQCLVFSPKRRKTEEKK